MPFTPVKVRDMSVSCNTNCIMYSIFLISSQFSLISGEHLPSSFNQTKRSETDTESGKVAGVFDMFPRFTRLQTMNMTTIRTQNLKREDQPTTAITELDVSTPQSVLSAAVTTSAIYTTEDIPASTNTSWWQQLKYPCSCYEGTCGCCTGQILQNFNFNVQQRGCVNVTYYNDDFEFHLKMIFNNRVFYQRRVSGKNPRPICIPLPRFTNIRFCVKFSNIYMIGRNMHMCIDVEGLLVDYQVFAFSFDCIRLGSNGFAVIRPEDGGGLGPPPDEDVYVPKPKPTKPPKPQSPNSSGNPKPPAVNRPQSTGNKPKPPKPNQGGQTDEDYDAIVASEGDEIGSAKSVTRDKSY